MSFFHPILDLDILRQNINISNIPRPRLRLHTENIITPPRSATPYYHIGISPLSYLGVLIPHSTHPNIIIRHKRIQHPRNSTLANHIRTTSKLA
jgi:hypothetical protein